MRRLVVVPLLLVLSAACEPRVPAHLLSPWGAGLPVDELRAREALAATPIVVEGHLVDEAGAPVAGATVTLGALRTVSDADGRWSLEAPRHNEVLLVEGEAHRPERRAVQLLRPLTEARLTLEPVLMRRWARDEARLLFTGDAALGRRYLDTDESTPWNQLPPDDPLALIQSSDPGPGARSVFTWVEPFLEAVDLPISNLESPVLDQPDTPHPTKPYVFFTLPDALQAFVEQGYRYVSLGNNHVYDYLEQGLADTLFHVTDQGLAHSGAGMTPDEAFLPWVTELAGARYALLSMSSVSGFQYSIGFHATDTQGGSADLADTARVRGAVEAARARGEVPIVQLHTGREYMDRPSEFAVDRFDLVGAAGAALIIGHHPHYAQGFGYHHGALAAHSLGNFAFDQDRVETMMGLVVVADLRGDEVLGASAVPVYLEDYRPRPMTGDAASRLFRRMGWVSVAHGAHVVEHGGRARVTDDPSRIERRAAEVVAEVTIGADGLGVLDLRDLAPARASLAAVAADVGVTFQLGRDLLLFGDFEDIDTDAQDLDLQRWDVEGDSRFGCVSRARHGAVALCSLRDETNAEPSLTTFRNRLRVIGDPTDEPEKDLTLFGWSSGDNAGRLDLEVEIRPSEGEAIFETLTLDAHGPGTWDWTPFAAHLRMADDVVPPGTPDARQLNPRALRFRYRHHPPRAGRGLLAIDDAALVSWSPEEALSGTVAIDTPHPHDFLRLRGEPGTVTLTLRFETTHWRP